MSTTPACKFACVCASNVNRSMAAHNRLMMNNFDVRSYGTNRSVVMPGPPSLGNNLFEFGSTYKEILAHLQSQRDEWVDEELYQQCIGMIERDAGIKERPERFRSSFDRNEYFDVVFTYTADVMQKVLEEFHENGNRKFKICHVINIETPDNDSSAREGAGVTLELAKELSRYQGHELTEHIERVLNNMISSRQYRLGITFHCVSY